MEIMIRGLSEKLIDDAANFGAIVANDAACFRHHKMVVRDDYVKLRHLNNPTGSLVIARDEFYSIEVL